MYILYVPVVGECVGVCLPLWVIRLLNFWIIQKHDWVLKMIKYSDTISYYISFCLFLTEWTTQSSIQLMKELTNKNLTLGVTFDLLVKK